MGSREEAITGCLLGTAAGDALGLAAEGLSYPRQRKLFPNLDRPRLLPGGRGMVSDDTEHACLLAQSLIESAGDAALFQRRFARRLRIWFLGLPAGIGLATLRACLKLLAGVPPERSGVRSAGNGPAMRSALLGVCYGDHPEQMRRLVQASTRITHTDPKAEAGAMAVAVAAYLSSRRLPADEIVSEFREHLHELVDEPETLRVLDAAIASVQRSESVTDFAAGIGAAGYVRGYILQTVPVAIHCWLSSPADFEKAVRSVIACGGDTDTTAAIVGAMVGAGGASIPSEWLDGICEKPCSIAWMRRLATQLSQVCETGQPERPVDSLFALRFARNFCFALVVLAHGLRRLAPPY
ncbi:dinitrogenase reductase activating glycohydrolase [Capsulimonas corticalis]|uniref:Dinitrogenase reductase activating glycohydrolase n=1 Tax=Capsulimonas corticalis TaxID=2219043 RepID=A0A402CRH4_9BACT|nr:ADP-ribosylglycohydrolase family protein [Capsulimonas corticalis]BDI28040.1 dinitrogenase reductase activating glycohydrolase [Capsulimonas corticalis]